MGKVGTNNVVNRRVGNTQVERVYRGTTLVWENFTATGGSITQVGNDQIHTFSSSGTFTISDSRNIQYLVVAGGGGGGLGSCNAGTNSAGGAGGVLYNASYNLPAGTYSITVGQGGATNNSGQNSSFSNIATATGGGRGGIADAGCTGGSAQANGGSGGSGGSAQSYFGPQYSAGTGISGQGNNAGSSPAYGTYTQYVTGGGGGAGAAGGAATGANSPGAGGIGRLLSISGVETRYGGGGGGGSMGGATAAAGAGLIGQGGTKGGAGQSGVVIIRFTK